MDFPRSEADLDLTVCHLFDLKNETATATQRRQQLRRVSESYRHGQTLPFIEYSDSEVKTWQSVFKMLTAVYPSHASAEFLEAFDTLTAEGLYSEDFIPQFEPLSAFMKQKSDFSIRPVGGMLSPRFFLAGLALRVFHATPHVRPIDEIDDSKEPDICHELLGHVPLLLNKSFADFSQAIGMASLGASDEDILRLTAVYWFTVEFGLCYNANGELRAYGAGLLGCANELQFCLSKDATRKALDIDEIASQCDYPLCGMKPVYYVATTFQDACQKVKMFCSSIERPFSVHYDSVAKKIEVNYES